MNRFFRCSVCGRSMALLYCEHCKLGHVMADPQDFEVDMLGLKSYQGIPTNGVPEWKSMGVPITKEFHDALLREMPK